VRRRLLAELGRTNERFQHILSEAAEGVTGASEGDLKRLTFLNKSLKGGVAELDAHARFLQGARLRGDACGSGRLTRWRPRLNWQL